MAGWHHWLNGHGFGWTPGVSDGQGGLEYCGSRGCKESDTTEQLNWNWKEVPPLFLLKYSFHFLLVVSFIALYFLFKHRGRTALEVPWLRLHASTAGGTSLIPGWGAKIPHASWCSKKKKKKKKKDSNAWALKALDLECKRRRFKSRILSWQAVTLRKSPNLPEPQ